MGEGIQLCSLLLVTIGGWSGMEWMYKSWYRTCLGLCNIEKKSFALAIFVSSEPVGKDSYRYPKHTKIRSKIRPGYIPGHIIRYYIDKYQDTYEDNTNICTRLICTKILPGYIPRYTIRCIPIIIQNCSF